MTFTQALLAALVGLILAYLIPVKVHGSEIQDYIRYADQRAADEAFMVQIEDKQPPQSRPIKGYEQDHTFRNTMLAFGFGVFLILGFMGWQAWKDAQEWKMSHSWKVSLAPKLAGMDKKSWTRNA